MDLPLLGLDIGTTHCKAGLFDLEGHLLALASLPMAVKRSPDGSQWFAPEIVWETAAAAIRQVLNDSRTSQASAVGITSMAESGLLVEPASGSLRSEMIPWFDPGATAQVEQLRAAGDPQERFQRAGIRPNFKCSLAKILWLRAREGSLPAGLVWLMAADYIAYCLTGNISTDPSLAGRTYAFHLSQREWDTDWLNKLGLDSGLFPPLLASGVPLGGVLPRPGAQSGLVPGTPVAVCGHDHVVAAFAAGAVDPGSAFNSMGTAEALVGALPCTPLGEEEYLSGLVYGPHVIPERNYWMGGLSASGGSVEWIRGLLGEPALTYPEIQAYLERTSLEPTGILYFPYLSGSGSPHTDLHVRAAFVGLSAEHGRSDLLKALLEGTAYEVEFIRRAAEKGTGISIDQLKVSGGATRNPVWMQIKADVSGCRLGVAAMPEASLLGAALLAGVGTGIFSSHRSALATLKNEVRVVYMPDWERHQQYQVLFEQGFLSLQASLREIALKLKEVP